MEILIDRRAETASRVSVNAPLEFKPDGLFEPREGDCVNLSTGGVSIRTPFVPEVGEDIACRFEFTPAGSGLEVTGRVMWAHEEGESGGRFGVRFTGLDERSQTQIARALAERSNQGHARTVSQGERPAQLLLDGVSTPISAHVARRRGRLLTFEQELPLLQIGRGLSAEIPGLEPITGTIASVDLRLRGDMPRLMVTVGVTSTVMPPSPNIGTVRSLPEFRIAALRFFSEVTQRINLLVTSYFAALKRAIDALPVASIRSSWGTIFVWTREQLRSLPTPTRRRRTTAAPPAAAVQNTTPRRQIPSSVQRRGRMQGLLIGASMGVVALLLVYLFGLIEAQTQSPPAKASRLSKESVHQAAQTERASSRPATPELQMPTETVAKPSLAPANPMASPSSGLASSPSPTATSASPIGPRAARSEAIAGPVSPSPRPTAVTKTQAVAAPSNAQSPRTDQIFFGAREVKNGRYFSLRMSNAVTTLQGIPDQNGFTVLISGSLALDRAGPIASAHPWVKRSMIVNKGDHSVLTIGFTQGASPAYRVAGKGAVLEIVIAAPHSS